MRFEDLLINSAYLLKWCAFLAGIRLTVLTFLSRARWIRREFFCRSYRHPFALVSLRASRFPIVAVR